MSSDEARPPHADGDDPLARLQQATFGLLQRFQLVHLVERYPALPMVALFALLNGFLSIALMSAVALVTGAPFVFPSLGPTAFLFFYTPLAPAASPRNTVIGHLIGAAAGWLSLVAFGVLDEPPALTAGVTTARIFAAGASLGLTAAVMVLLRAPHPPAGATTLIVSLGLLNEFSDLVILMIAVVLLSGQAIVINRLAGIPYPLWSARDQVAGSTPGP